MSSACLYQGRQIGPLKIFISGRGNAESEQLAMRLLHEVLTQYTPSLQMLDPCLQQAFLVANSDDAAEALHLSIVSSNLRTIPATAPDQIKVQAKSFGISRKLVDQVEESPLTLSQASHLALPLGSNIPGRAACKQAL